MEESSQGSRRVRPESSSSRDTKMTPSSSNSSTAHLPLRSNTGTRAASGASLLHERLRERKAESARQSRRRSIDFGTAESSPIKANMVREERRPSSSGVTNGKGMGVKQIEEQVSTLHKQNFDLKLELYHRRQRQEALEARLEAAEKEIAEQRELQEVNEQLLAELEKRDQAVEEAVGIIVNLEDKVERLMQDREAVKTFDSQYDPGYFRESHQSSSPPTFEKPAQNLDTKAIARMPSFLSEQSEGAEALRSLYMPHSYSDATLPKLSEVGSDVPDSPRLSVLSESSFMSVYGDKTLSPGAAEEDEPQTHRNSESVEKWIEDPATTPQKPRVDGIHENGFLSINDVLESPLQRLEKLKHTLEKHNTSLIVRRPEPSRAEEKREARLLRRGIADKGSFDQQALPPTPDTISTSTLRHFQVSTDTLNQQASGLNASTFPNPFNAYQSALTIRPRSAGETVTSRREGHGWDTETGEDVTETGSLSSTASAYTSQRGAQNQIRPPPDMFSFNSLEQDSYWGRDMMFNSDASRSPQTERRELRRRGPHSDAINSLVRYDQALPPLDNPSRPSLPDRRSSLSATTKLRKPPFSASSPISKDQTLTLGRKSRLAMPRLFTRTDPTANTQQQGQRPRARNNSYIDGAAAVAYEDGETARATPPPIRRNRTAMAAFRPSSAGQDMRARGASSLGHDGAADEDEGPHSGGGGFGNVAGEEGRHARKNSGARKWLGLGRSGSMHRT